MSMIQQSFSSYLYVAMAGVYIDVVTSARFAVDLYYAVRLMRLMAVARPSVSLAAYVTLHRNWIFTHALGALNNCYV